VEGRGSDDREPVVVEPPKRVFLFWALLGVALAGYGLWELHVDAYPGLYRPEVLLFMGVMLPVLLAFQWGRRIVVTPDLVVELRYGKEVARAPSRSIRALGFSWLGRSLVFENGVRIPFNEAWDNGGWLRSSFAVMVDARRGGIRQEGNWVQLDFLRFPERCLGCNHEQFRPKRIFLGYRIITPMVSIWWGEPTFVPACERCIRRHRVAFLLTVFIGVPIVVALGAALIYLLDQTLGFRPAVTSAFVLGFGAFLVLPNVIPVLIDSRYLGVGGSSIRWDRTKVWIRFRNPALREELLTLAQEAQMEHLHAAAVYLKE
jgi:hypothetical protein